METTITKGYTIITIATQAELQAIWASIDPTHSPTAAQFADALLTAMDTDDN